MLSWLSVVVPVIIAVAGITANAIVNIKIKFAASAEVAKKELKELLWKVAGWLFPVLIAGILIDDVFSTGPLTDSQCLRSR